MNFTEGFIIGATIGMLMGIAICVLLIAAGITSPTKWNATAKVREAVRTVRHNDPIILDETERESERKEKLASFEVRDDGEEANLGNE